MAESGEPPKRALQRKDQHHLSLEEGEKGSLDMGRKSRSFEERAANYRDIRKRIFDKGEGSKQSSQAQTELSEDQSPARLKVSAVRQWVQNSQQTRLWSSEDSATSGYNTDQSGTRATRMGSKANSFGGTSSFSRGDSRTSSGTSGGSRISIPESISSGYSGGLRHPPIPSSPPLSEGHHPTDESESSQSISSPHTEPGLPMLVNEHGQQMAFWLCSNIEAIPPNSILINPATREPYRHSDGSPLRWQSVRSTSSTQHTPSTDQTHQEQPTDTPAQQPPAQSHKPPGTHPPGSSQEYPPPGHNHPPGTLPGSTQSYPTGSATGGGGDADGATAGINFPPGQQPPASQFGSAVQPQQHTIYGTQQPMHYHVYEQQQHGQGQISHPQGHQQPEGQLQGQQEVIMRSTYPNTQSGGAQTYYPGGVGMGQQFTVQSVENHPVGYTAGPPGSNQAPQSQQTIPQGTGLVPPSQGVVYPGGGGGIPQGVSQQSGIPSQQEVTLTSPQYGGGSGIPPPSHLVMGNPQSVVVSATGQPVTFQPPSHGMVPQSGQYYSINTGGAMTFGNPRVGQPGSTIVGQQGSTVGPPLTPSHYPAHAQPQNTPSQHSGALTPVINPNSGQPGHPPNQTTGPVAPASTNNPPPPQPQYIGGGTTAFSATTYPPTAPFSAAGVTMVTPPVVATGPPGGVNPQSHTRTVTPVLTYPGPQIQQTQNQGASGTTFIVRGAPPQPNLHSHHHPPNLHMHQHQQPPNLHMYPHQQPNLHIMGVAPSQPRGGTPPSSSLIGSSSTASLSNQPIRGEAEVTQGGGHMVVISQSGTSGVPRPMLHRATAMGPGGDARMPFRPPAPQTMAATDSYRPRMPTSNVPSHPTSPPSGSGNQSSAHSNTSQPQAKDSEKGGQ